MFTTFIIFIVSALTASFILINKIGQTNGSGWYIQLHSHEFEHRVINRLGAFWDVVSHWSGATFRSLSAKFLQKIEKFFMKTFFKLFRYINKLSDMVKGKDVPKNKGSASFFLKRIDEVEKF